MKDRPEKGKLKDRFVTLSNMDSKCELSSSDVEELKNIVLSRVGASLKFDFPQAEGICYLNFGDKLTMEGEEEEWCRLGYYRYYQWKNCVSKQFLNHIGVPNQLWNFAGQETLTEPLSRWADLLAEGCKKDWFLNKIFIAAIGKLPDNIKKQIKESIS